MSCTKLLENIAMIKSVNNKEEHRNIFQEQRKNKLS